MKPKIKAITFDLWDTLFADDTDEPKRQKAGVPPKPVERRELAYNFLQKQAPISKEIVETVYNACDAAFNKVWHEQFVTWSVSDRMSILLTALKRELPQPELEELIRLHEEMELRFRPDPAPGVNETIEILSKQYKLGVISDAIFSPGRALRQLLEGQGLLNYFDSLIFSDEAGASKPMPIVFEKAAAELGVELNEIVHIGDREHNDVGGPHAVGARAVFFTVVKDRGHENTKAEAICDDFSKLPSIIEQMNQ